MTPNLPWGQDEVFVKVKWFKSALQVRGYYEPAERGSREDGVQMEPDTNEQFDVASIWLDDIEITDTFNDETLEEIEVLTLQQMGD